MPWSKSCMNYTQNKKFSWLMNKMTYLNANYNIYLAEIFSPILFEMLLVKADFFVEAVADEEADKDKYRR